MLTRSVGVAAVLIAFAIGSGTAVAQNPAPGAGADKKAISKSCSDQANAKGLHGKARKKFRSACKHHGGHAE